MAANGPRHNLRVAVVRTKERRPAGLMCAQVVRERFREDLVLRWTRKVIVRVECVLWKGPQSRHE
jgi:hypothetical protein